MQPTTLYLVVMLIGGSLHFRISSEKGYCITRHKYDTFPHDVVQTLLLDMSNLGSFPDL